MKYKAVCQISAQSVMWSSNTGSLKLVWSRSQTRARKLRFWRTTFYCSTTRYFTYDMKYVEFDGASNAVRNFLFYIRQKSYDRKT